MLIFDISQILISSLMVQMYSARDGFSTNDLNEDFFRHITLNIIRSNKVLFKDQKNVVLACDSYSWRKQKFPFYKQNRTKNREKSPLDWDGIFKSFRKITKEIKDNFAYRVITVDGAEGDDIIGTLVLANLELDNIIISRDQDFKQLHFTGVRQYDPIDKKFVSTLDYEQYLCEHIIAGDVGDGVPNILSDDNSFIIKKRQTPLSEKRKERIKKVISENICEDDLDKKILLNYKRNKTLIDLRETPIEIKNKILEEYNSQEGKKHKDLLMYLGKHDLRFLHERARDFL